MKRSEPFDKIKEKIQQNPLSFSLPWLENTYIFLPRIFLLKIDFSNIKNKIKILFQILKLIDGISLIGQLPLLLAVQLESADVCLQVCRQNAVKYKNIFH